MSYIVWRLQDADLDLWLPTNCDTFAQAADAWLEIVQSGGRAEIMERVSITLTRSDKKPPRDESKRGTKGTRNGSRTDMIIKALEDAPDGLSRAELAARTGIAKTNVGASIVGLQKIGRITTEQGAPGAERGTPAVGRDTVTIYRLKA